MRLRQGDMHLEGLHGILKHKFTAGSAVEYHMEHLHRIVKMHVCHAFAHVFLHHVHTSLQMLITRWMQ